MKPYKRITNTSKITPTKMTTLQIRPSKWMLTFVLLGLMVAAANAVDETKTTETKTAQPLPSPASSSKSVTDEIYIDDEGIEGSGGHGGLHDDDLEKEPDYSGSGFGPDDEDSSTGHIHHSKTHNTHSSSSSGSSSNSGIGGSGGITSSNSDNTIGKDSTNRKDPSSSSGSTHVTQLNNNLGGGVTDGSGDGDDHDTDDDNDDDDDDDIDHEINRHIVDPYDHDNKKETKHDDNDNHDVDDDKDDDNGLYTDVTDPNESDSDDKVPDRSGETNLNKEITSKTNDEFGLDLDHTSKQIPTDQNSNSGAGVGIGGNEVLIMNTKNEDRTASFFAQPGILAAVIGGAVVGLLCAILVVMFIVYRMRKKDEGSYALDEPKRSPAVNSYAKNGNNREFYA